MKELLKEKKTRISAMPMASRESWAVPPDKTTKHACMVAIPGQVQLPTCFHGKVYVTSPPMVDNTPMTVQPPKYQEHH